MYWESWSGILILARGLFLGNLWRGPFLSCTVSEMKAVSCSTVRVVSMLAMLLGSVPLCRVNAEQQVTELPPLCQATRGGRCFPLPVRS